MASSVSRLTDADPEDVFEATSGLSDCEDLGRSLDFALERLAQRAAKEAESKRAAASSIEPFRKYVGREVDFCTEVLGQKLWAFQRHAVDAFFRRRFLAVAGGRKGSKTETEALLVIAAVCTRECIVLTTGPGDRQVKEQLWQRIAKIVGDARAKGAQIPGELQTATWRIGPEHYAIGFSTGVRSGESGASRAQGWHAGVVVPDDPDAEMTADELAEMHRLARGTGRPLYVVLDEAASIEPAIYNAFEGSLSGPSAHQALFLNPTLEADSPHPAVRAFAPGSRYHRLRVTQLREEDDHGDDAGLEFDAVFRTPAWLYFPDWVEQQRVSWGEDSPLWKAYVEGRFPQQGVERRFVTKPMLDAAEDADLPDSGQPDGRHIGVDVARQGADESVATLWICGVVGSQHSWRSDDLMETSDVVVELMRAWSPTDQEIPARNVHVDGVGMGAGVVDRLRQMGRYVDLVDVGSAPKYDWKWLTGQVKFANRKAELHWVMRRLLQERKASIPASYVDLRRQASWARYEFEERVGGTQIAIHRDDSKEGLRERYGRSPDQWDSAMLGLSRGAGGRPSVRVVPGLAGLRKLRGRGYRR
ncbi:MAG TPA: hypothetical protein PKW35_00695 [Nannocystaceae bacterium]|nr:hypothetical protein [Nannocystaceae bacterium]